MTVHQVAGAVQWIAGVAAGTFVVMLFTLGPVPATLESDQMSESAEITPVEETSEASDGSSAVTANGSGMAAADADLSERGESVYAEHCAVCHGLSGLGATADGLAGRMVEAYPDAAEQVAVIAGGRGIMPAFADRLTLEEINAVVAFTRHGL